MNQKAGTQKILSLVINISVLFVRRPKVVNVKSWTSRPFLAHVPIFSKTVSGTQNALYKSPRVLYTILRQSFKYSLATSKLEVKEQ